ncbi:MAG: adenylyltransferase/cytidyltransferase family protein [Cyanobacteria bacterium HKST-UBA05]|nr:adenylyltransferase/cytidyltransferase family protein [Cyanobacteria bacterium HKST-UBA05]
MAVFRSVDELARLTQGTTDGQRVLVTTNGCFDLMHVGHLRYLKAARAFGDRLVVLLNSDASVRRLKGSSRPILPEDERAELLDGLACVDHVGIFDEDTPERWLEALKPNIHVKGGQYSADTLPEAALLKTLGTRMEFVEMVQGRSTSDLILKIQSLTSPLPTQ